MKSLNLGLAFLLEIVAVVALVIGGLAIGSGIVRVIGAIVLPVVAIVVWSKWAAPQSPTRLPFPKRLIIHASVFGVAFAALLWSHHLTAVTVFAAFVVLNEILLVVLKQN